MATRLRSFSALVLCFSILSCHSESLSIDVEPLKVVSFAPNELMQEDNVLEIEFSKPAVVLKNKETCFRFAKSEDVSVAQVKRVSKTRNPEHVSPFLPIIVDFSTDGYRLHVQVPAKLEFAKDYSLWIFDCIRDRTGNRLEPFELRFRVQEAPFSVVSHDLVLVGDDKIYANRTHFRVRFSHKIASVPKDALILDNEVLEVALLADAQTLVATIPNAMRAETLHTLTLSPSITDVFGRALMQSPIVFKSVGPSVEARRPSVGLRASGTFAEVEVNACHLHVAKIKYRTEGETTHHELISRENIFRLEALKEEQSYTYEIEIEDVFGRHYQLEGTFNSTALPNLALNEIMLNPKLKGGTSNVHYAFIELYNFGETPIDISDFSLEVDGKDCQLAKGSERMVVRPNSYILLVGNKFDPRLYDLTDSSSIVRLPRQTICGRLKTWPLPVIFLKDGSGRKVDAFLGMSSPKEKGFSVERLNPNEKNGKEKYCYSRANVGTTPLRRNGIVTDGCE